jgi:hypothetical protein
LIQRRHDRSELHARNPRTDCRRRPDGHVAWRGDSQPRDALALIDTARGAGPRIGARRADAEIAPASL